MFCPECGTNNGETSQFCVNCGLNLSKIQPLSDAPISSYQNQTSINYEAPLQDTQRTHSPIIDNLEDAQLSDYRDQISAMYYLIAFFFFPVGIVLWALNQKKKPESAKNLLAATVAGFFTIVLLLTL